MVVLLADLAACRDAGWPGDDARVTGSAVELVALPHLERRVEGHRPTVRVMVVGLRAAEIVEEREVVLDRVGDPVEELHLVDRPVRATFTRGAVVRDEHDQRVVPIAELLEIPEQPPDLIVGVREEPGVDLGHSAEQRPLVGRQRRPGTGHVHHRERLPVGPGPALGRADRIQRRQFGLGRHEAEFLLPGEGLLAHGLIAHVESPLVLGDPLRRGVVGGMARARRVVEQERLLGGDRLRVTDELNRLVGEIHGQVIALLGRPRLIDGVVVVDQIRIPLAGLGPQEPVPALEAAPARPVATRRCEVHLVIGTQVPLADHVGVPAELAENLGQHAVLGGNRAAGVREADGRLGDAGHAVAGVVAAGQQARAGG